MDLFGFMLDIDKLPIALYRKSKTSRLFYVVTNPALTTVLTVDDFVFVCDKQKL